MALIHLDLINNSTTTIDSSWNSSNTLELGLVSSGTLIVNGATVNLTSLVGGGVITNTTIQLENGANVTVNPALAGVSAGSTFHYLIGAGTTLTLQSGLISVDLIQNTTVDFLGSGGAGHFVFTPPVLGLSLSAAPNIINANAGDQVTVTGSSSVTQSGNVVTFHGGVGGLVTLAQYTIPAGAQYTYSNTTDTLTFTLPCFVRGTRVATPDGEVPVEYLSVGDMILSFNNGATEVKWIGKRTIDPKLMDKPRDELPVHIHTGAIAENVPHRDLFVSPDHCMFINGSLIPAKLLINGTTITQEIVLDPIEYFHIELEEHDVIWAEGAQTETYLDLGNRKAFLEPGVLQFTSIKAKEVKSSFPLAYWGPAVDQARALIAERETALGYTTDEAKAS